MDAENPVAVFGRAKRFAKIGGEVVSLKAVEGIAVETAPLSSPRC